MAFIDTGDQFLALFEGKKIKLMMKKRHFGLVVEDRTHIRELARKAGAQLVESEYIEFYDPWAISFK